MVTVLCMKWGWRYGPEYVDRLHAMVARHLRRPHRFVCLTDEPGGIDPGVECRPLPLLELEATWERSPWRKLSCLSDELADLDGPVLFLDLDVVLVDDIDCFFEHPGSFCIIENWTQPGRGIGNSSVFRFEPGRHADVLAHFEANAAEVVSSMPNEQTYLSRQVPELVYWPPIWCRSFKHHCLPGRLLRSFRAARVPVGARIVVFHGQPKPPDAARGVWPGRRGRLPPVPWIDDNWR